MRMITWNVNGLRACMNKGFREFFDKMAADVFCIQETKMQPEQVDFEFPGYHAYYNSAEKKGYSSTALFSKVEPLSVVFDIGVPHHDKEGRVITAEYDDFYLVNCYTPNSKDGLLRLDYRMEWEDCFRNYLKSLKKPVILCGDLNVAHQAIDLKNPKTNTKNPGFTAEERNKMTELLAIGFIDIFRYLYPEKIEYTWWSYRSNARANNTGWRIDYFIVAEELKSKVRGCRIHGEILGSDHCPVELTTEGLC